MTDDTELLQRYIHHRTDGAFAELVNRHVDLVYGVALRHVAGDRHLAEDVTQVVFTTLARKPEVAARRPVLAGWLYRVTQFAAIDAVRVEARRRRREQEAVRMEEFSRDDTAAADWGKLRPVLDRAIGELNDDDRDAVVLRFFNGCSFAAIGAQLKLTENAARMRVQRALDKLHSLLAKHGVGSTTAALATALAQQSAAAAPAGLATSVIGAALTGTNAVGVGGWITFMSTTKIGTGVAAILVAIAVGTAVYEVKQNADIRAELVTAKADGAGWRVKAAALSRRAQTEATRAAAAERDNARLLRAAAEEKTAAVVPPVPVTVTHDLVQARFKHGQELARNGDYAAALAEYLWCYDEGMVRVRSFSGVRNSFLTGALHELGASYPEALTALRDRRDAAEKRMLADSGDHDAASDFKALNHALGEDDRTLAVYDQLAPTDSRRRALGSTLFGDFIRTQRYADAAAARPFSSMSSLFEMQRARSVSPDLPNADAVRNATHNYIATSTVQNIEALAGVGDIEHARELAGRLLAYDGSDETKSLLQQSAIRAGHPDIFRGIAGL
jgi:RNA polymerase sigma factor (sigma-70 family)